MTGEQLKQAREQLQVTQAQLAKAVGLSRVSIARYEMNGAKAYLVPKWLSLIIRMWLAKT